MAELAELIEAARASDDPTVVAPIEVTFGGIDPLGLREINFDLMNDLFSGLNNVASHVRPYVLTTWSWSRALQIAGQDDRNVLDGAELTAALEAMEDFVDRVEVIYLWSQILRDPAVGLPGRWSLGSITSADHYDFGGPAWTALRRQRRDSTSFRAAANYGPGLRNLGWARSPARFGEILVPTDIARPAISAFERVLGDRLEHPAFSAFGSVRVTRQEVEGWGDVWALDTMTDIEMETAADLLAGEAADARRRRAFALLVHVVENHSASVEEPDEIETRQLRSLMAANAPTGDDELDRTLDLWRRLQTRQVFRLALESLYAWITRRLGSVPRSTGQLVRDFLDGNGETLPSTAREWLATSDDGDNPMDVLGIMMRANEMAEGAPLIEEAIRRCLVFCLSQDLDDRSTTRHDRLPIARAKREAESLLDQPPDQFMRHAIEAWVLAQHTYWSVGRGLADARAGGKRILRLRVVMEEGGWTLSDGRGEIERSFQPTGDRLATALSLARECGVVIN